MLLLRSCIYLLTLGASCLFLPITLHAACPDCCAGNGGIHYCDSSSGRYVCKNGNYSSCYCTRHAVMDLQRLSGCCTWQGGVMLIDPSGLVICNNGGVSELCTLQQPVRSVSIW